MKIGHIIPWRRTAFNEMAVCPFFDNNQGMLKLACAGRIQAKITLQRHTHMDAFRHIDERTARPYRIMERCKLMIPRGNQLTEVRFDQIFIFFDGRFKIYINDTLLFQFFLHIVIHHFRIVLGAYAGKRFLFRFRNTEAVKSVANILRQIFPPRLPIRFRADICVDVIHIELRNIGRPGWHVERLVNTERLKTLFQHP